MERLTIYCDGGSRGNPGPGASAFVLFDEDKRIVREQGKYLGHTTNNQAEYTAVLLAFQFLHTLQSKEHSLTNVHFFLDSELVTKQLNGEYRIRDQKLQLLALSIKQLERSLNATVMYKAIPRVENKAADQVVNRVLDGKADILVEWVM